MHPQPFEVMNDGKGDTVSLLPITFIIRSSMKERQTEMGKTPSYGGTPKMEVRVFENAQFGQVRTAKSDDAKIWFCLADVAKALSLPQVTRLKSRLKSEGVTTIKGVSKTTNQHNVTTEQVVDMNFIDEPNLYRCIFQSRKKEAEQFQDWVCEEVLPAIRQSGGYLATQQEDTPELIMARALQVAQATIERHQQQLESAKVTIELQSEQLKEQAPKVEYTDSVLNSTNTYTSTQIAKELNLRTAEQLHALLKTWGVMIRQSGQWMLAAKYCGQNYTKTRTHSYTKQDGTQGTNSITVWTERGRWFLHQLIQKKGGVA